MRKAVFTLILTLYALNASAAVIDTTPYWNGSSSICCFGEGSSDTYGQTFTVIGADTVLDEFSFWVDDRVDINAPIDFSAYIMEWHDSTGITDPRHPVGSILYSSAARTTTNNAGAGGMERVTFSTGGVQLIENTKYVAFISSSLFWDGINSSGNVGSIGNCCDGSGSGNVYAGGEFVVVSNGKYFMPYITETGWNTYPQDLAFSASFSNPVPLPSAVLFFSSGLIGLFGLSRRAHKHRNRNA